MSPFNLPADLTRLIAIGHPHMDSLQDLKLPPRSGRAPAKLSSRDLLSRLPVAKMLPEIIRAIDKYGAAVIEGTTGSGKSTLVPLKLLARTVQLKNDERIVVAVPRRVAARSLATFTASLIGQVPGELIGYQTQHERKVSKNTQLIYCTDGFELARGIFGDGKEADYLILDEQHERNLNQDLLLAVSSERRHEGAKTKLIVMSATVDTSKLSQYLGNCPVVQVGGSLHPIEWVQGHGTVASNAADLLSRGISTLVFVPGKREIDEVIQELELMGVDAELLPLHADQEPNEQLACFVEYGRPKCVIATAIAESSLTIPGIRAVVDSGLRRLIHTNNHVQGLFTVKISNAEMMQRAGRCGREAPGKYIALFDLNDPKIVDYPSPEISRLQLENFCLRTYAADLDPAKLKLLNPAPLGELERARTHLIELDLLDEANYLTPLGEIIAPLPISVNLGRMLYEARRLGVLEDALIIAALVEAEGIDDPLSKEWRDLCPESSISDLTAHRDLFLWARDFALDGDVEGLVSHGINLKKYKKAVECYEDLVRRVEELGWRTGRADSSRSNSRSLSEAFVRGFPRNVFVQMNGGFHGLSDHKRHLSNLSFVRSEAKYVVGIPYDISTRVVGSSPRHADHRLMWTSEIPGNLVPSYIKDLERAHRLKHQSREIKLRAPGSRVRKGKTGRKKR